MLGELVTTPMVNPITQVPLENLQTLTGDQWTDLSQSYWC